MSVHQCPQCGAAVEASDSTLATSCAFCDSPLVVSEQEREPVDQVVPFDVPRERAAQLLRGFVQGHWFVPPALRKVTRPDSLDGVMVPFYAFDADARSRFSCRVGLYWYRTETYTVWVDGKPQTRTRQVRETEWFPFEGSHARTWRDHLVSASTGLPEVEANQLEPFDLGRAKPFDPSLVAGWVAEVPTIDHGEAEAVARTELAQREKQAISAAHLPGDTSTGLQSQTSVDLQGVRLVLLPVWIAALDGGSGPIRLLVNGQTGEVVGTLPRDWTQLGLAVFAGLVLLVGVALCFGLGTTVLAALGGN